MLLEAILMLTAIVLLMLQFPRRPKNYPPGPFVWPLIGNVLFSKIQDPSSCAEYITKKYGSITGFVVPFYTMIAIDKWDAMQELYTNDDCQGRPDVPLIRDRFEGGRNYGILFTDGDSWKAQRKFVTQNFRHIGFGRQNHETLIQDEALELVKDIKMREGKPFSIEQLFYLTNINITWAVMSSHRYGHSDPDLKLLAKGIYEAIHDVTIIGSIGNLIPVLRHIFPEFTGYRSIKEGGKIIRSFAEMAIVEHRKSRIPDDPRDFVDAYLDKIDEEAGKHSYFTDKELTGICMDFLLAGGDTSTGTMCFQVLLLAMNQDIQQKVYDEIISVIGPDEIPSIRDRSKLVYCDAFLSELFRYRPIAPVYPPHRVMKDTKLMGYDIPKDTVIFPDISMILMDEETYPDPKTFRPERYIGEDGKVIKDERLLPFGKGKRSCLGEMLARMSGFLIFVTLAQRFKFTLPPGEENIDTKGKNGFTLTPPKFRVIATPRKQLEAQNSSQESKSDITRSS